MHIIIRSAYPNVVYSKLSYISCVILLTRYKVRWSSTFIYHFLPIKSNSIPTYKCGWPSYFTCFWKDYTENIGELWVQCLEQEKWSINGHSPYWAKTLFMATGKAAQNFYAPWWPINSQFLVTRWRTGNLFGQQLLNPTVDKWWQLIHHNPGPLLLEKVLEQREKRTFIIIPQSVPIWIFSYD